MAAGTHNPEGAYDGLVDKHFIMKTISHFLGLWILSLSGIVLFQGKVTAEDLKLKVQARGSQLELRWPAVLPDAAGTIRRPLYEVQWSSDLIHWAPLNRAFRGSRNATETDLSVILDLSSLPDFFRLAANLDSSAMGQSGENLFGYATAFQNELTKVGQVTAQDFLSLYGPPADHYSAALTWDPTTAPNWSLFMPRAGEEIAYAQAQSYLLPRIVNFRLNSTEAGAFQKNGFVASERLGAYSFAEAFYQVYMNDRPVFISTDAILQAWRITHLEMIEELEELFLAPSMESVLKAMADGITPLFQQYGDTALKDSLYDADYFLSVARSLMAGSPVAPSLNQGNRVTDTLNAVANQTLIEFPLFGENRVVDFSQFIPRGHYVNSDRLQRYFKMMMWCGRIDLRLTPAPEPCPPNSPSLAQSLRELGTAVILTHLAAQSGQLPLWQQCDQVINAFVGWSDSMSFNQMAGLLAAAGAASPANLSSLDALQRFQADLENGDLGIQNILSDYYEYPMGPSQAKLPKSFTVCGQRFTPDSWALSQVVFPSVYTNQNGIADKVMRRIPSCLDIAFSVLANDDTVPELARRMTDTVGRQFRDNLPYAHNLIALRRVLDQQSADAWDSNIYMSWLAALRELSTPTTAPEFPQSMRTRAWAMKNLTTQMASWTHLRATTILYSKQSYTGGLACSYPHGFVEPRTSFYQSLRQMALRSGQLLESLSLSGTTTNPRTWGNVDLATVKSNQVSFMTSFAATMDTLSGISQKELAQQPLTAAETVFVTDVMERQAGYINMRTYNGWYPKLYYRPVWETGQMGAAFEPGQYCDKWDATVTDVHTDVPAPLVGDPGCILHEAVGNVWMMVIAIDNGSDRLIYAGPVLSHYEFEKPMNTRMTVLEWKNQLRSASPPNPSPWTSEYFVPGTYQVPVYP